MLKNWNTDKIVGAGLILALILSIIAWLIVSIFTGNVVALDFQTNLVTGLAGYMGRSLLEKNKIDEGTESK